ncbi:MAG: hypothetical protein IH962_02955 [Chloroflexi bacterium]|nr:hypothetical protein [Chloroflexota bacterium]
MVNQVDKELPTRTDPGTAMGEVMRRYSMATMIAVPFVGSALADDDGEKPYLAPVAPVTYTITGSDGQSASFGLVEFDGEMTLVLRVEEKYFPRRDDDDDD